MPVVVYLTNILWFFFGFYERWLTYYLKNFYGENFMASKRVMSLVNFVVVGIGVQWQKFFFYFLIGFIFSIINSGLYVILFTKILYLSSIFLEKCFFFYSSIFFFYFAS